MGTLAESRLKYRNENMPKQMLERSLVTKDGNFKSYIKIKNI